MATTDWRQALLLGESTLRRAAEVLTQSSMRIVLVVDKSGRLQGTVTDGDIRRALIRGIAMDAAVEKIMERDPITVFSDRDKQSVITLMRVRPAPPPLPV